MRIFLFGDAERAARRLIAGSVAALALFAPWSALALQQPDNTTIPVVNNGVTTCSDKNVQVCLNAEEGGPTIDALAAGNVLPETYDPNCNLTFRVLARGAGFDNTFGWYNVNPNGKPPDSDLHAFLLCSDDVGTTKTLDIKNSPLYTGGQIGFFMASPEGVASVNCPTFDPNGGPVSGVGHIYYSERSYNPDNQGANSFIHLITYQSVTFKDSFYFAWEDLLSGGDNDFDDLLTRVEGIQCSGGGTACQTGQPGICNEGSEQCKGGVLECVPIFTPAPEKCNALDDDCSGKTDEGDLCPLDELCDRGKCVPRCGTGEFQCTGGLICNSAGLCVDPACETKTCKAGEICVNGTCVLACDGVVCPYGELCRNGRCLDPCDTIVCDTGYACDLGVCTTCSCNGCPSGKVCSSEKCIDTACESQTCDPGFHCEAGTCVDDCKDSVCPKDEICIEGDCKPDPDAPDGGGAGGADGGGLLDGGIGPVGGVGGSAGSAGGAAAGNDSRPFGETVIEPAGCGCRTTGTRGGALFALIGLGAALAALRRRSRHA